MQKQFNQQHLKPQLQSNNQSAVYDEESQIGGNNFTSAQGLANMHVFSAESSMIAREEKEVGTDLDAIQRTQKKQATNQLKHLQNSSSSINNQSGQSAKQQQYRKAFNPRKRTIIPVEQINEQKDDDKLNEILNDITNTNVVVHSHAISRAEFARPLSKSPSQAFYDEDPEIQDQQPQFEEPNSSSKQFPKEFKAKLKGSGSLEGSSTYIPAQVDKNNNNMMSQQDIPSGKEGLSRRTMARSSTIFDDEYFFEDSKKQSAKKARYMNPEMFHKLRDHHVTWNQSVFFEFLFYHIVFYMILGPLTIIPFYRQRILMRNLSLWGNVAQFYIQTVFYFTGIFNVILYFTAETTHIYPVEIIYMEVVVFLRAFIIACKYATLHPDKIELYKKFVLTTDLTANDYYFARWIFQKDVTIYRESYNAMQRGEFDASLFYMSFFVDPSKECISEIDESIANLSTWHQQEHEEFQPKCIFEQEKSVYGYGVLSYIVRRFADKNPNFPLFIGSVVLAFTRGFLLLIYRKISGDQENESFTKMEIVQIAGIIYNTSFGYFSSFIFLIFFTKDLRMKDYFQKQCLLILSPKKMALGTNKVLPTINFLDPFSLKAWSTLRRVLIDYGKPYYLRLEAFITVYIFVATASLAALILWLFDAYGLPQNIGVACGFEAFFIFAFLIFMLVQGAQINSNFDKFKNVLIDYRVLLDDLIRLRKYYFMEGSKSTNMIRSRAVAKIKAILLSNQHHLQHGPTQANISKTELNIESNQLILAPSLLAPAAAAATTTATGALAPTLGNTYIDENVLIAYVKELINGIDDCIKELEQDFQNQPFLFFGVKITPVLVQNMLVGLATTAVAVVQYYLSIKK